ncbi:hypothetical protein DFH06DRAFT_1143423 [Mycena polygramma]|nr:hypothetical protein DFH06DRAFT_1143423 [Mycena polygramma]
MPRGLRALCAFDGTTAPPLPRTTRRPSTALLLSGHNAVPTARATRHYHRAPPRATPSQPDYCASSIWHLAIKPSPRAPLSPAYMPQRRPLRHAPPGTSSPRNPSSSARDPAHALDPRIFRRRAAVNTPPSTSPRAMSEGGGERGNEDGAGAGGRTGRERERRKEREWDGESGYTAPKLETIHRRCRRAPHARPYHPAHSSRKRSPDEQPVYRIRFRLAHAAMTWSKRASTAHEHEAPWLAAARGAVRAGSGRDGTGNRADVYGGGDEEALVRFAASCNFIQRLDLGRWRRQGALQL